jgi:pyruvate,orthophosphate dikinase
LSPEANLKAVGEILSFSSGKKRRAIFKKSQIELGEVKPVHFIESKEKVLVAEGIPAHPGLVMATGAEAFVNLTTTPEDVAEMKDAKVILTGGGLVSHAALYASSAGIPCVVGFTDQDITAIQGLLMSGKGVSVDAYEGKVYKGILSIVEAPDDQKEAMKTVLTYASDLAPIDVLANADTPEAIQAAFDAGATGVGLLRTEHSYQEETASLSNYLKASLEGKTKLARKILTHLLSVTTDYFQAVFNTVGAAYTCIRLLDAPLNEFGTEYKESNPMMGLRGCRFGILFPDFYVMQVQAIATAYREEESGGEVGIMIPMVSEVGEVVVLWDLIMRVWQATGADVDALKIGAMIETPRACMISGELAQLCDFLSYGTNDLTQFAWGISRDDATYLPQYVDLGVLEADPFKTLDQRGVCRLLYFSAEMAARMNPEIQLGVCGNHAGDPLMVKQLEAMFHYVSCPVGAIPGVLLALAK